MGLGKMSVLAVVMTLVAVEAHSVAACELKRASRAGVVEAAAVRKPAKPVEPERIRVEHREAIYYSPTPSRRIILQ